MGAAGTGGGGGDVPISLTAATNLAAGTAVSVNGSGEAVQTWGPAPNIGGVVTVGETAVVQINDAPPFAVVLTAAAALLVTPVPSGFAAAVTPCTIAGETITLGTADTSVASVNAQAFAPISASQFVVAYADPGNTGALTVAVGTITAGVIAYGTPQVVASGGGSAVLMVVLTASLIVIGYNDDNTGNQAFAALSISGSAITVGTPQALAVGSPKMDMAALSATAFAAALPDSATSKASGVVGTVSGTTITLGTLTDVSSSTGQGPVGLRAFDATHIIMTYAQAGNSVYAVAGSISTRTITWGTPELVTEVSSNLPPLARQLVGILDTTHAALAVSLALPLVATLTAPNALALSPIEAISTRTPNLYNVIAGNAPNPDSLPTDLVWSALAIHSSSLFMVANLVSDIAEVGVSAGASTMSPLIEHRSLWGYFLYALDPTHALAAFITWDGRFQARIIATAAPNASAPIGCVATGVTAGNAASIVTTGACGGFSGLTAGAQYYANGDGSVTTVDTGHPIGVAISATQLAVNPG